MMKRTALVVVCIAVASCASLQQRRYTAAAEDLIEWINGGRSAELASASQTPFLLDREIVILEEDIATFWDRIIQAGFRIPPPRFIEASAVTAASFEEFGSTMEVQTFFEKYVSERAYVVRIETADFAVRFLVDRIGVGRLGILGMKGPEPL